MLYARQVMFYNHRNMKKRPRLGLTKKRYVLASLIACLVIVAVAIGYVLYQSVTDDAAKCVNGVKQGSIVVLTDGALSKERLRALSLSVHGKVGNTVDDLGLYEIIVPAGQEQQALETLERVTDISIRVVRNTCVQ